jgi:hypothetical protein
MLREVALPTAKKINEEHRLARSCAETAVDHAIRCGEMLIQVGADQMWIERHTEVAWSTAKRYMSAAKKKAQGIPFESLRHCFPSGKKVAPAAEKRGSEATAVAKKGAPAAVAAISTPENPAEEPEKTPAAAAGATFSKPAELAPEPDFDFSGYEPEDDDAYKANIENVMMADDKLAAMREELKQLHREVQGLKASRDHYQAEAGSAVRLVNLRDREIEKLRKQLEKAWEQNEALRERIASTEAA